MTRSSILRGVLVVGAGAVLSLSLTVLPARPSSAQIPLPSTWPTTFPLPTGVPFPIPKPTTTSALPTATATASPPPTPGGSLHALGLVRANPTLLGAMGVAQASLMDTLPTTIDLSNEFPPIGDQGAQGSCVGWSTGYAMKSYLENHQRGWGAKTTDHQFSPAFIYNQHHSPGACIDAGMDIPEALGAMVNEGVATLKDFPYAQNNCTTLPSADVKKAALGFKIESFRRVPIDVTEVRSQLAAHNPIVVGIHVDAAFDGLKGTKIYNGPVGKDLGGHAIAVVGYDDAKKAFRFMNSWGKGWGDNGFAWVSYAVFPSLVDEAYTAQDFSVAPAPPTPNPPVPVTTAPSATMFAPTTVQDVIVDTDRALVISFAGNVHKANAHTYQIVVRFTKDGAQIPFKNAKYKDVKGFVAAATPKTLVVAGDPMRLEDAPSIAIPHAALWPISAKKPATPVKIKISYDLYVEGFHLGRSNEKEIVVTW